MGSVWFERNESRNCTTLHWLDVFLVRGEMMTRKYVSFKDKTQPVGKRKVAYVHWLMRKKGYSLQDAKLACHKKFSRESSS